MTSSCTNNTRVDRSLSPTLDLDAFIEAISRSSSSTDPYCKTNKQDRKICKKRPLLWRCVSWDRHFNETSDDARHTRLFPPAPRRSARIANCNHNQLESVADASQRESQATEVVVAKTRVSKRKEQDERFEYTGPVKEPRLGRKDRSRTPEDTIRVVSLPEPSVTPRLSISRSRRRSKP